MEPMDHFGAWQRRRRKVVIGLTQAELATLVFCSKGMIAKIETGDRRPAKELAERLVAELGVPPHERSGYVAWARGLPQSEPAVLSAFGGHLAGGVVRLNQPVGGHQDWVLMPLNSVTAAGLSIPCTGIACNGKDPEVTGCANTSLTVEQVAIKASDTGQCIADVELRFSRVCQTNWARVTRLTDGPETFRAYLRDEHGEIIDGTSAKGTSGTVYVYGLMWYAPTGEIAVQACGVVEGHDEVCTNLH
jgi:transcriptional regulator with XRE-family HTH domain